MAEEPKIVFKKNTKSGRQLRIPVDDDNDKVFHQHLDNIREKQKMRQRPKGMSIVGLSLGKKLAPGEELTLKSSFNLKTGGLVNMKALRTGRLDLGDDDYDVDIGTQFSAETNKRDEDEEMMKYIDRELEKRKGVDEQNKKDETSKWMSPEDAALFALPEHLRKSNTNRSEEMLSYQMLNGIPEVDLGVETKIRNIEATEEAKQKLIQARLNKKDLPSHFVPTNMAVNFMQHNRFDIEENSSDKRQNNKTVHNNNQIKKKSTDHMVKNVSVEVVKKTGGQQQSQPKPQPKPQPQSQSQTQQQQQQSKAHTHNKNQQNSHYGTNGVKRATDDYHYDKFKKQFRRY